MSRAQTIDPAAEALHRARIGHAMTNYPAIFEGFLEKGLRIDEIRPRENIFTFNAWRALGRTVRRGETGVKILTWIEVERDGHTTRRPKSTTVFHISQTEARA
jgi:hypothetical protein